MRMFLLGFILCAAACLPGAPSQSPGHEGDFDLEAAERALLAVDVSACRAAAGPSGKGHVKVTFAPDGSVSAARFDKGEPNDTTVDFGRTPRGDCILERFRAATVPAFTKSPVAVGKTITLE